MEKNSEKMYLVRMKDGWEFWCKKEDVYKLKDLDEPFLWLENAVINKMEISSVNPGVSAMDEKL